MGWAGRVVGLPRSAFYYTLENNSETVAEVQAIIHANNREQLGLIQPSKNQLLHANFPPLRPLHTRRRKIFPPLARMAQAHNIRLNPRYPNPNIFRTRLG